MPLINCPECNHQVSDAAVSCPNCAHPLKTTPTETIKPPQQREGCFLQTLNAGCGFIGMIIGVIIVIIIFSMMFGC